MAKKSKMAPEIENPVAPATAPAPDPAMGRDVKAEQRSKAEQMARDEVRADQQREIDEDFAALRKREMADEQRRVRDEQSRNRQEELNKPLSGAELSEWGQLERLARGDPKGAAGRVAPETMMRLRDLRERAGLHQQALP